MVKGIGRGVVDDRALGAAKSRGRDRAEFFPHRAKVAPKIESLGPQRASLDSDKEDRRREPTAKHEVELERTMGTLILLNDSFLIRAAIEACSMPHPVQIVLS